MPAIDPRRLRPSELTRLVNSTPLGEVLSERQLYRHRARAGFRIGDGRHVDLFRYTAWLVHVRHQPKPEPEADPYAALKERARARSAALAVSMGDRGCLSIFGDKPDLHRLFAEHLTAEYRVKTQGRGRPVDEWKMRPSAADNHWFDCLVGCAVAASMQGVALPQMHVKPAARRPRLRLSELQGRRK